MRHCLNLFLFAALGVLLGVSACSDTTSSEHPRRPEYPDYRPEQPREEHVFKPLPWELWQPLSDLNGVPLKRFEIIQGDEFFKQGDRRRALSEYQRIRSPQTLAPEEREALALRVASCQLATKQAPRALTTISEYFHREGKNEEQVDANFAVILGFAYGKTHDLEQSLAWFSRAQKSLGSSGRQSEAAQRGVVWLLRSLNEEEFESSAKVWRGDEFLANYFGQERKRRSQGGSVEELPVLEGEGSEGTLVAGAGSENAQRVGVLLPLTGRFASLGKSTKNGIDLALEGEAEKSAFSLLYQDDGGDPVVVSARTRELIESQRVVALLGPLLSELAGAASDVAQQGSVPIVTYSKKDVFRTGNGVFRLGATLSSQVRSLIDAANKRLGFNKFGLVYPSDPNGEEAATAFREQAKAAGLNVVFESTYPKGDPNALASIAEQAEQHNVQAIFFPDSILEASRFFASLTPAQREKIVPLGLASWDNQDQLTRSLTVMDGAVLVSPFFTQSERPLVSKFNAAYEAKFHQKPDFLAAQGFDSATLVLAAVKRHMQEGLDVTSALQGIDGYEGLTGKIYVKEDGEIVRDFAVVQFRQGKLTELDTASKSFVMRGNEPVSGDPVYSDPVKSEPTKNEPVNEKASAR